MAIFLEIPGIAVSPYVSSLLSNSYQCHKYGKAILDRIGVKLK